MRILKLSADFELFPNVVYFFPSSTVNLIGIRWRKGKWIISFFAAEDPELINGHRSGKGWRYFRRPLKAEGVFFEALPEDPKKWFDLRPIFLKMHQVCY